MYLLSHYILDFRCIVFVCPIHHGNVVFFFKQKTAYEMRISDWSSDVCSSDLLPHKHGMRHIDERVLDIFVESWNSKQVAKHEPFILSWVQKDRKCAV